MSGLNTFPAMLKSLSTGAEDAEILRKPLCLKVLIMCLSANTSTSACGRKSA